MSKTNKPDLSKCTVADLCAALRDRPEVVAMKVWTTEDIRAEAADNFDFEEKEAEEIAAKFHGATEDRAGLRETLENCSSDWEAIDDAIGDVAEELGLPRHP